MRWPTGRPAPTVGCAIQRGEACGQTATRQRWWSTFCRERRRGLQTKSKPWRAAPTLGYIETLAGELFLESQKEIGRLLSVHDHLKTLAMSPAESIKFIREKASGA